MLSVTALWMTLETGSSGRPSQLTSWRPFQARMTKRPSLAWVRTKKTADLAARLIRTIDRFPPSAECCVTASG